ncbi:MAG: exo-beta-N-acetylmuramidase NamZ domain-containing protein, partial [Thermocrispum sp.]
MRRRSFLAGAAGAAATPLVAGAVPAAAAPGGSGRRVITGADALAATGWADLAGQRVGIVTNPTGVTGRLRNIVDEMHASGAVDVVAVFGPEHGFRGTGQAGDGEGDHVDPRTGIMVYDAYGADAAKFAQLYGKSGVQTVVFDIQDVGARFYTYIWTMYQAMAGAVPTDLRFVVLDRPNPVGGHARGPM